MGGNKSFVTPPISTGNFCRNATFFPTVPLFFPQQHRATNTALHVPMCAHNCTLRPLRWEKSQLYNPKDGYRWERWQTHFRGQGGYYPILSAVAFHALKSQHWLTSEDKTPAIYRSHREEIGAPRITCKYSLLKAAGVIVRMFRLSMRQNFVAFRWR